MISKEERAKKEKAAYNQGLDRKNTIKDWDTPNLDMQTTEKRRPYRIC